MTRPELLGQCLAHLQWVLSWLGRELPELRAELASVEVQVKAELDDEDIARGATDDLRGYYFGELPELAPGETGTGAGCPDNLQAEPGQPRAIVLFAQNIQPLCRETVAAVFVHELGHLCGFDEFELEDLGL